MVYGFLRYCIAFSSGSCEYFSVDERAGAFQFHIFEDFAFVELEGTVYVSDFHAEEQTDELGPAPGVDFADDRIAAVEAITTDYVVLVHQGKERGHLGNVKLAVAVGIEDELLCGGVEARLEGGAVAEVGRVVDDFDGALPSRQPVGDAGCFVGAAVVNDDDLEVGVELAEDGKGVFDGAGDIVLLIVTGKENADGRRGQPVRVSGGAVRRRVIFCHRLPPLSLRDSVSLYRIIAHSSDASIGKLGVFLRLGSFFQVYAGQASSLEL